MKTLLKDLFVTHPESVDETYFEHMGQALSFAGTMAKGMLMALVHAFIPGLFEKSASRLVTGLHDRMVTNRVRAPQTQPQTLPQGNAVSVTHKG
ncbi:DUF6356 family protein [Coralliovum pocilloporae]|uniref:DUF6356 family protein n=1 Tax=Coralliovum pocilloporae TaxID=3066369 RepID=UPI003307AB12